MAIIFVILIVVSIGAAAVLIPLSRTARISDIQVINVDGTGGIALVVYHPGISSFHEDVTLAFVDGLVSNDWRVELTTASEQTPANLSGYDLLVLGGPGYGDEPAVPVTEYVSRVGDFGGIETVLIITAAGSGAAAMDILETQVQETNATVVLSLLLYLISPNEEQYGSTDPLEIATNAGEELPLP